MATEVTPDATQYAVQGFGVDELPNDIKEAVDAAAEVCEEVQGLQLMHASLSMSDQRQILAQCTALINAQDETHATCSELIQRLADGLSYIEARYWSKRRPVRSLAAVLTAAINGTVFASEAGTASAIEATPELVYDSTRKAFVATTDQYVHDNFPSYAYAS